MRKKIQKFIVDSLEILLIGSVLFFIINVFLGQLLLISGDSMSPALKNGEQLIGEKISLNFTPLERKEIVIFQHPKKRILVIKRIIGLPKEKIKIENDKVYINGETLEEPYVENRPTKGNKALQEGVEYTIPDNHYLLLGDNRPNSIDSRVWGFLNLDKISSRALFVYYPINRIRLIKD